MPVGDLLAFPNVSAFAIALDDSSAHRITGNGSFRLFDTTAQSILISWHAATQPAYKISIDADSRKYHRSTNTKLPAVWRTRDGVYPWITIDSLQMINEKPFYIEFAGPGKFRVINWEEGKLATSGVEMLMKMEGNETTEKLMSSQDAIDKKLKIRGVTMEVWGNEWSKKGLTACKGNFGDYPQATNRLLTEKDLANVTTLDLCIMRNEIFGRHGYIFKSHDLKARFEGRYWYKPRFANVEDQLTDIEKQNIKLIVAREDYMYRTRPLTEMMKGLPLLSLPLSPESDFGERVDIPANIENPDGFVWEDNSWGADQQKLVGLLPDTSRFYGVIWYAPANLGLVYGNEPMLTTFDKKFKRIGSTALTVSVLLDPGGECNTDETSSAILNEDLSFSAHFHATITCSNFDNDGTDHGSTTSEREEGFEGRIGKDGMISVKITVPRQQN
jgi:hypothetical protein